eukprot:TRINITY_DN904_c0_g2_i1.p2 TRINITY_DN904_c0_g2~~TRINITY_DN904_c0_g2_i1.p2  ORF type:complete len:346 (-),score=39.67 TRINITY_DN904_c0_g2_i1:581-1618(-)
MLQALPQTHSHCQLCGASTRYTLPHAKQTHSKLLQQTTNVFCDKRYKEFNLNGNKDSQTLKYNYNANGYGVCEIIDQDLVQTEFVAETQLPTIHGKFRLRGYRHSIDGGKSATEPVAVIVGEIEGAEEVPVRVHDACFTSEVLGSMKCDCAQQLELALNMIQDNPPGMVIYLQQEGRGIGLANKIAAYKLQEEGLDTVDANRALGLPDDCREYTSVVNILRDLDIKSVKLMTNNPRKIDQLRTMGVTVVDRIPVQVVPGKYNQGYLDAKRTRMDHQLDGSFCWWNHEGEPGEPSLFDGRPGMQVRKMLGSHVVTPLQSRIQQTAEQQPENQDQQQIRQQQQQQQQ